MLGESKLEDVHCLFEHIYSAGHEMRRGMEYQSPSRVATVPENSSVITLFHSTVPSIVLNEFHLGQ